LRARNGRGNVVERASGVGMSLGVRVWRL